jgi:hypothetical protein
VQGKDVLFVTNNSMKCRSSYATKCEKLNIHARQVGRGFARMPPAGHTPCSAATASGHKLHTPLRMSRCAAYLDESCCISLPEQMGANGSTQDRRWRAAAA